MKCMSMALKGKTNVCFMDFEGTQFSHEMIALGAILVSLDRKGNIKTKSEPFKVYVRAKNKIGPIVTNLTGITEDTIKEHGIQFSEAMKRLKKYIGRKFESTAFITFGNHDMRILSQSSAYNMDSPNDITKTIFHNYIDFLPIISDFVKDENNNPYSLINYCKVFNVPEYGKCHDPEADAVNLANLYQAFISSPGIVYEEYRKVLAKYRKLPEPIKHTISLLIDGKTVTPQDFDDIVKDFLKK